MGNKKQTVLDTDRYSSVVNGIENTNDLVIEGYDRAKNATADITTNNTVPHFVNADSDVIKMLQELKGQVSQIVDTMRSVQTSFEEANQEAYNTIQNLDR